MAEEKCCGTCRHNKRDWTNKFNPDFYCANEECEFYGYNAGLFFAMYMLEVLGMAFFKFNRVMNIALLAAVMCVTTSTIDSIAVALHEGYTAYGEASDGWED